ncbi:hypothetical protein RHMOL_Rhmol02G0209200 [Rhododendron molle]|uniref:Uncharacterized protein n=1 Tax=Rhododendron molle TaxID=49168 RepID=A0ACC0PST4_RHOML|nr:hypothetical protein RHMOL_Rhmol02G0209200 [Rhododendron molle]
MSGPPDDHSARLYDKYKEVLPSLREKHDEFMLRELMKRWANHKDMVYRELKGEVRDAVITLIGMGQMVDYENDFEDDMLKDSASYYSRKASNWIVEDSCPDYMLRSKELNKYHSKTVTVALLCELARLEVLRIQVDEGTLHCCGQVSFITEIDLEMPKSETFALNLSSKSMFADLMSRW